MEDVLEIYHIAYDPDYPVVYMKGNGEWVE